MYRKNKMTCPICLTNEIKYKCNDCVDGGVCYDCSASYCSSGWSCTINKDETKCPVCRQIQYKWIYSECVNMIVYDCVYDSYDCKPVMNILTRNVMANDSPDFEDIYFHKARKIRERT